MKKHSLILSLIVLSCLSGLVLAEAGTPAAGAPTGLGKQSALEGLAKKAAKDAVKSATPGEATEGEKAVGQATEKANAPKEAVPAAPVETKGKPRVVTEKAVKEGVPGETKTGVKAVEEGAGRVEGAPTETAKSVRSIKQKTEKATVDKAKELMQ